MKINQDIQLQQIAELPGAAEIFDKYIPGRIGFLSTNPQTKHMSLRQMIRYSKGSIPAALGDAIEKELVARFGTRIITPAEEEKIKAYKELAGKPHAVYEEPKVHTAFYPGQPMTDTEGKRIEAHGGAILYEDGVYYFYGENKEYTHGDSDLWTWGVRAYRSEDLYNWTDLGQIIEPDLDDPDSLLFPENRIDRPHILRCPKTGKYVCWIHLAGRITGFMVLEADKFTGPYTMVHECLRPDGRGVGDFDLIQDENGTAYLYYDADHSTVYGLRLTPDYRDVEATVSTQYENMIPPFCREGAAYFEREGKKYMLSSGMTGYIPNKGDAAVSDAWDKPFISIGNPYPADESNSSYNSQFTDVFKVPGKKDLYIAMSDRWVPDFVVDARIADIMERAVAKNYMPEKYSVTPEEQKIFDTSPNLHTADTSRATYVWLPIDFSSGSPQIFWRDRWTLDEFE